MIDQIKKKKISNSACIPKLTKSHSSISRFFLPMKNLPKTHQFKRTTIIHHLLPQANKHLNIDKIAIFVTHDVEQHLPPLIRQPLAKCQKPIPPHLPQNQKIPSTIDRAFPDLANISRGRWAREGAGLMRWANSVGARPRLQRRRLAINRR